MGKLINVADFHYTSRGPRLRSDDFKLTMLGKAQFIVDKAKENDCEAILISGDLFDSPFVSIHICDQLMEVLRGAHVPILVLAGNHDLDRSLSSLDRVPLGHYARVKWLTLLTPDKPAEFGDWAAFGLPYEFTPDRPTTDLSVPSTVKNKFNIVTTHHLYMHQDAPYHYFDLAGVKKPLYTKVQECTTNTDLVLLAHQHDQKEGYLQNGVLAWGPGSPTRLERTERNTKRYIGLIEVAPGVKPDCKLIEIPLRPGDEVFDLEKIQEKEKYVEFMDKFVASLKDMSIQSDNLPAMVHRMANEMDLDPDVVKEVLKTLAEAQTRCCGGQE